MNRVLALRVSILLCALLFFARSGAALEVLEELIEQKYPVDAAATLSVHGTDGSIRVYTGGNGEIALQAIKKAYTSDRLKQIAVDVKATSNGVTIETRPPPPKKGLLSLEDRSGTIDYIITIPDTVRITKLDLVNGEVLVEGLRGNGVIARVVNGWLVARNCFGDLDLSIDNGRLEAVYDWWEHTKFDVKLTSPDGNIRAMIPRDASVSVVAKTTAGRIMNLLAPRKETRNEPVGTLTFTTGPEPKAAFEINSISGDIRIEKSY